MAAEWDFQIQRQTTEPATNTKPQRLRNDTVNPRTTILTLAVALASAAFAPATVEAGDVKGNNVKMVLYGEGATATGMLVETERGKWIEHNADGRFTFIEEGRDEWSVYLVKVGRQAGQKLQLDLHRKTVSTGSHVFYKILRSFK